MLLPGLSLISNAFSMGSKGFKLFASKGSPISQLFKFFALFKLYTLFFFTNSNNPKGSIGLPRIQTEIWMLDSSTSSSRVRIRDALMLVGVRIPLPSQRNLKTWWQALTPQQQSAWYLKKQQVAPGSKRRYDDINHIGRSIDQAGDLEDEVDNAKILILLRQGAEVAPM